MRPSVAIAHDYLTQRGGAERVVLALARAFPEAPIYTTLYDPENTYPEFAGLDIRTSPLNHIGFFRRNHRFALPLLALASSLVKVHADVVVASSSGWAHGFRTDGKKLVYCYAPARWLYEPGMYLGNSGRGVSVALRLLSPLLKRWDKRSARTAARYLAISSVTQGRILRTYGIHAEIVPAPHSVNVVSDADVESDRIPPAGYLLVVSRLLPYKNIAPIVEAFRSLSSLRLVVVGVGPQLGELQRMAGSNVVFLSNLSDAEMSTAYKRSAGLIAASFEDFGLTPLEAAAYGKPAAVLRWGGFLDTVVEGQTGIFFDEPDPGAIANAVMSLVNRPWHEAVLRQQADSFGEGRFASSIQAAVREYLN